MGDTISRDTGTITDFSNHKLSVLYTFQVLLNELYNFVQYYKLNNLFKNEWNL